MLLSRERCTHEVRGSTAAVVRECVEVASVFTHASRHRRAAAVNTGRSALRDAIDLLGMMPRSLLVLAATAAAAPYKCDVEHAFGAAAFARRSTLTVDPDRANHNKLKFAPDNLPLIGANATAFAELLKADGVYRIRVRREGARAWASASIRACDLAASNYEEDLSVALDARGDVEGARAVDARGAAAVRAVRA